MPQVDEYHNRARVERVAGGFSSRPALKGIRLLFVLYFGLIPFLIASINGGVAGAIVAGGRENRSLVANAGIGFTGWVAAFAIWGLLAGELPQELSLGIGILALFFSIGVVNQLEKRSSRPEPLLNEVNQPI